MFGMCDTFCWSSRNTSQFRFSVSSVTFSKATVIEAAEAKTSGMQVCEQMEAGNQCVHLNIMPVRELSHKTLEWASEDGLHTALHGNNMTLICILKLRGSWCLKPLAAACSCSC